jgi:predicted DCC family thiol-disulfide oxidoreductase YuxK
MSDPRLVYDDDCAVCTRAARWVGARAAVELVPFSAVDASLADRLPADWRSCAHLLTADTIYSCGEAMARAYELTGHPPARLLPALRRIPGWPRLREAVYRLVASNRSLIGRLLP